MNDEREKYLPQLEEGQKLTLDELLPEQHFTKPPPRYTEASLVKKLEEEGIGRPSTYAPTISTVQQRGYIQKDGKQLKPQDVAFTVTDLLTEHFTDIVDLQFTAQMEQSLDDIAEGAVNRPGFLREFFDPFNTLVETKSKEIKKEDVMKEREIGLDPETGLTVVARVGRFGPYVQLGKLEEMPGEGKKKEKPKSASLIGEMTPESVTLEEALSLLSLPRIVGQMDDTDVEVNTGRYGPYVRVGKITASLPKDADIFAVTLEEAIETVKTAKERKKKEAEPLKELGEDPNTKLKVVVKEGRYGPYVTDGEVNASIPKKFMPEDVDLPMACQLLDKKRNSPKKSYRGKKK